MAGNIGSDPGRPSRIPVRVYARTVTCDLDDTFNAAPVSSWDEIIYITGSIDLRGGNDHFTRYFYAAYACIISSFLRL